MSKKFYATAPNSELERFLHSPRFELIPQKGLLDQARQLPRGSKITVTCPKESGLDPTIRACRRLLAMGMDFHVVPHIAARWVKNKEHLKQIRDELIAMGVEEIFVPGGDPKEPIGDFASSLELLVALNALGHEFAIGVAAHESHPFLSKRELFDALYAKQEFATYMVTQISCEPERVIRWLAEMRQNGITLPVYIGFMGRVSKKKLRRVAKNFGIRYAIWFLWNNPSFVRQFFNLKRRDYIPDDFLYGLAPYLGRSECGIAGLHFNTLNEGAKIEQWRLDFLEQVT